MSKKVKDLHWKPVALEGFPISDPDFQGFIGLEECTDYGLDKESKKPKKKKKQKPSKSPPALAPGNNKTKQNQKRKSPSEFESKLPKKIVKLSNGFVVESWTNSVEPSHGSCMAELSNQGKIKQKQLKTEESIYNVSTNSAETSELPQLSAEDMLGWAEFKLPEPILRALTELGFKTPTLIQQLTLPAAIHGRRDILGAAETGSGKTLAFGLPILTGILKLKEEAAARGVHVYDIPYKKSSAKKKKLLEELSEKLKKDKKNRSQSKNKIKQVTKPSKKKITDKKAKESSEDGYSSGGNNSAESDNETQTKQSNKKINPTKNEAKSTDDDDFIEENKVPIRKREDKNSADEGNDSDDKNYLHLSEISYSDDSPDESDQDTSGDEEADSNEDDSENNVSEKHELGSDADEIDDNMEEESGVEESDEEDVILGGDDEADVVLGDNGSGEHETPAGDNGSGEHETPAGDNGSGEHETPAGDNGSGEHETPAGDNGSGEHETPAGDNGSGEHETPAGDNGSGEHETPAGDNGSGEHETPAGDNGSGEHETPAGDNGSGEHETPAGDNGSGEHETPAGDNGSGEHETPAGDNGSGEHETPAGSAPGLEERPARPLYALVLTPTRELAQQVARHLAAAARHTGLRVALLVGGLAAVKQERVLRAGPELVVATPGRLWELAQQGHPHLQRLHAVRFLAIDETDRMLERGHFEELHALLERLNAGGAAHQRQTFVFSATLTLVHDLPVHMRAKKVTKRGKIINRKIEKMTAAQKIKRLVSLVGMESPKVVDVTSKGHGAPASLTESRITCARDDKDVYLYYILRHHPARTIVFCNSIGSVRRLATLLGLLQVQVLPLHAAMPQRQRLKNLERFRESPAGVLVATDVAARGLDIPGVEHVLQYHVPRTAENYVHRSGRTARALREGLNVLLVEPGEAHLYSKLCRTLHKEGEVPVFPVSGGAVSAVRGAVCAARALDALELRRRRWKQAAGWRERAATEMDIIIDERDLPAPAAHSGLDREVALRRRELAALLARPIYPRGFSFKYPHTNPPAALALHAPPPTALQVMKDSLQSGKLKKEKRTSKNAPLLKLAQGRTNKKGKNKKFKHKTK